jgi:hypothetical protein
MNYHQGYRILHSGTRIGQLQGTFEVPRSSRFVTFNRRILAIIPPNLPAEQFAVTIWDEVDLDRLAAEMVRVVEEPMQPEKVMVTLREKE